MAISHSAAVRTNLATVVLDAIDADASPGELILLVSTTPAATIVLNKPSFTESGGQLTLDNTGPPSDSNAPGGLVDLFDFRDGAGAVVFSGLASDITISTNPIPAGSVVDLTAFTYDASV